MTPGTQQGPPILIACVGNIFLGDDAFGVEVAKRLAQRHLPDGVRVVDFGIRGLDLAYALLDNYQAVVLVDAAPRGGQPGSLYVFEPELEPNASSSQGEQLLDTHNMDPARVLRLVTTLGGQVPRLVVVGCEPDLSTIDNDYPVAMSDPVRAAVDEAVLLIESLVERLLQREDQTASVAAGARSASTIPDKEVQTCHP
jgi:hydrogenase maturation protease